MLFLMVTLLALMVTSPEISIPLMIAPGVVTVIPLLGVSVVPACTPVLAAVGLLLGKAGKELQKLALPPPLGAVNFTALPAEAVASVTDTALAVLVPLSASVAAKNPVACVRISTLPIPTTNKAAILDASKLRGRCLLRSNKLKYMNCLGKMDCHCLG